MKMLWERIATIEEWPQEDKEVVTAFLKVIEFENRQSPPVKSTDKK